MDVRTGYIDVGDGRLYHERAGTGPSVVLVHAGMWDSRMWDDQFEAFAERFDVVRYDVRGFGRSDRPTDQPYSDHEDLRRLLEALEMERASLVAVSMGGKIAIDFALDQPTTVQALVLVASALGGYRVEDPEVRRVWAEAEAALEAGDQRRALELELGLWTPPSDKPDVDARARAIAEDNIHLYDLEDAPEQPLDPPAIGRLSEIAVPTLVVLGGADQPYIAEIGGLLAEGIAGARTVVVPGADHLVNMRRPAEFNRLVIDFLLEHGAG